MTIYVPWGLICFVAGFVTCFAWFIIMGRLASEKAKRVGQGPQGQPPRG